MGVDEAGRGALVGDVIAAAVILPKHYDGGFIADSKTLSEIKREHCASYIRSQALGYAIGKTTAVEIDALNIHHASLLAMQRAIEALDKEMKNRYTEICIDGKFIPELTINHCPINAYVGGDSRFDAIAAASILAKTHRDTLMWDLHKRYPDYGFAKHKGYPTKAHIAAIQRYGLLKEYRKSYRSVKQYL